jgi:MtN3 and saliva related transmembrane protein
MMQDAIGWISGAVLLLTLAGQIRKQIQSGSSKGVSIWLFVGQVAASIGFVCYSVLVGNLVFIITNSLILLSAAIGLLVTSWQKRRRGA